MSRLVRHRWMGAIPIAAAAAIVAANLGLASSSVHKVSTSNPYASCTAGGPGFVSKGAGVEPFVAVNPRREGNVIGVFQQDRWYDGGAHGDAAGVSFDGGVSWSVVALPFSSCAAGGADYQRASDPWVSIGPDGTAYANGLSFDETTPRQAITSAVSHDGGRSWSSLRVLIADNSPDLFEDKNSVTADPVKVGTAYVVWDHGSVSHNNTPAYFSKTTDGGLTWSQATAITSTADNVGTIGNVIVVDPRNGTLYDVFDSFTFSGPAILTAEETIIKSTDGGVTWSSPVKIADDKDIGAIDPVTGALLRTGSGDPDIAIDPKNGELYVVWEDARFSNGAYDEVALSKSTDGGLTWSAPERVNKPTGLPAVTPMVAVTRDGTVGVSYFDFRTLPSAIFPTSDPATLPTSYWLTTSPRGGNSFNKETAIITTPFDLLSAPFAFGYFLGDYQGLATRGNNFIAFFGQATGTETQGSNPRNRSNMYEVTIGSEDERDIGSAAAPKSTPSPGAGLGAQARGHTRITRR